MYSLQVTTGPTSEPVTLSQAKAHCRVDGTDEDAYITTLIVVARMSAEAWTNRAFIDQTLTYKMSRFPRWGCDIILPRPPLASVTSVAYVDTDGATQTDSSPATTYDVDTGSEPGRISLKYGQTWPTARDQHLPVTVVYQAGWSAASAVPETIRQAILLAVGHWYCHREVTGKIGSEIKMGWESLLSAEAYGTGHIDFDPVGAVK